MQNWILFSCLFLILSCQNEETFNSEKWKERGVDWQLTETREKMVNNLISSDTLIGLAPDQVILLLGEPEFTKEKSLEFLVREKHSWNIDPDYIKYLVIELDESEKVNHAYVRK